MIRKRTKLSYTLSLLIKKLIGKLIGKLAEKMAGVERLELPTIGFGDRCSTNWNYTPATASNYTDAQPKVKRKLVINLNFLAVRPFNSQIMTLQRITLFF